MEIMIDNFYLPILKSKLGEFNALSKLDVKTRRHLMPLFEIVPLEYDQGLRTKPRTLAEHLTLFCNRYEKKWGSSNSFIDTHLIEKIDLPNHSTPLDYIFGLLHEKNLSPIPVIGIASPSFQKRSIDLIKLMYGLDEIGIRISPSDITSPNFENDLAVIMDELGFSPEASHLIFDLKDSDFSMIEDLSDSIIDILEMFPHLATWKSFTICGTSFPPSQAIKPGVAAIPRNEWGFYRMLLEKLKDKSMMRHINYGDYSIVTPGYLEFDPTKMSSSANIRYTHDLVWYVMKGKALKKKGDNQQYFGLAKGIIDSKYFLGKDFSEGDAHILKCANKKTTAGSPAVWNWVGNNHHFTKVVKDLFSN